MEKKITRAWVRAKKKCFSTAIRRPGDEFEFIPIDGVIPDCLEVLKDLSNEKEKPAPTKDEIYAALDDAAIRKRLEGYSVKVPLLADRDKLIDLLSEAEGNNKPEKSEKKQKPKRKVKK